MAEHQNAENAGLPGAIVEPFAGPGGWDEGLRTVGLHAFGIELDGVACDTRYAAGLATWQADVSTIDPAMFQGAWGFIASPPCQDFSVAGKRAGITGERGELVLEVPRWVRAIRPTWVACEQVPPVLDIWRQFARWFEEWGYSCWTGILNAADYGVPQTRQRAFLLAHLDEPAGPPEPTHERHPRGHDLFGNVRQPWVTMAQALGWGYDHRGSPTVTGGGGRTGGAEPFGNAARKALAEWTLRHSFGESSPDSWTDHRVSPAEPAPTVDTKARGWAWERPATAVCADPRLSPPGYRGRPEDYSADGTYNGARSMDEAIKLTVTEALTLQGFRPDYPVQGSRTKQFEQVGNAVPPPLAAAVLEALIGTERTAAASETEAVA